MYRSDLEKKPCRYYTKTGMSSCENIDRLTREPLFSSSFCPTILNVFCLLTQAVVIERLLVLMLTSPIDSPFVPDTFVRPAPTMPPPVLSPIAHLHTIPRHAFTFRLLPRVGMAPLVSIHMCEYQMTQQCANLSLVRGGAREKKGHVPNYMCGSVGIGGRVELVPGARDAD